MQVSVKFSKLISVPCIPTGGNSRLTNRYVLRIFTILNDLRKVTLRDISNEDKTAGLFKNLRLEIFASPMLYHR